jgi:hypothetical protein
MVYISLNIHIRRRGSCVRGVRLSTENSTELFISAVY